MLYDKSSLSLEIKNFSFKDNWNIRELNMGEIFLVEVKCIFRKILRFDWFILKIYILERRKFFRIWETGENFSFERKLNLFKCLNRSNGKIALNIKFLNKLFFFFTLWNSFLETNRIRVSKVKVFISRKLFTVK